MITHLSALDFSLWAVQFLLELLGIAYAFRKNLWPLSAYLISRAGFDIITFGTLIQPNFYELAFWICKPLEYGFQAVLAVACVGEILRESKDTVKAFAVVLASVGSVVIVLLYTPVTYSRMINIEMGVNMVLALALIVGLAGERGKAPWTLIAWGLVIMSAADGSLGMLSGRVNWDVLARAYPIAEIGILGLWAYAAKRWAGGEFRLPLGVKIEGQAKGVGE